jgi:hypothetical protein
MNSQYNTHLQWIWANSNMPLFGGPGLLQFVNYNAENNADG